MGGFLGNMCCWGILMDFLGHVNGCKLSSSDGFSLGNFKWTPAG